MIVEAKTQSSWRSDDLENKTQIIYRAKKSTEGSIQLQQQESAKKLGITDYILCNEGRSS